MLASKYLILSNIDEVHLNDIGNGYIREFVKNGAQFIDLHTLYFRLGQRRAEEFVLKVAAENNIDALVYMAGPADFHFSLDLFRTLRQDLFTVMMVGDAIHYFYLRDIYYAQCMDLVVVYDCSPYWFQQYGINAISFYSSFDKNKYFIIKDSKRDIDISFVGNLVRRQRQERRDYIASITRQGFRVVAYGLGSENGPIDLPSMVEVFNRTKINLNFNRSSTGNIFCREPNINARLGQFKDRMAEIALCGGFVLADYIPGLDEVFRLDKEIGVFYSKEDLIGKIRYYLQHEDEREEIARNGYLRALKDYEISTAIPQLIKQIEAFKRQKTPPSQALFVDSVFIKCYSTFRISMIAEFIRLRKWRYVWEEFSIIVQCRRLDILLAAKYLLNISPRVKRVLKVVLMWES